LEALLESLLLEIELTRGMTLEDSGKHKIVPMKKLGFSRFRAAITFFFGITFLLYQNEIPVDHR
jgi:hypothetical protein